MWFLLARRARRSGTVRLPPPKHSLLWTSEFPAPFRSGGSAKPTKLPRRCCSLPPTMLRTFKARRSSSMAARRVRLRARRSIADRRKAPAKIIASGQRDLTNSPVRLRCPVPSSGGGISRNSLSALNLRRSCESRPCFCADFRVNRFIRQIRQ